MKSSTGYDLTQLILGSEGTLALVTEATLRLYPRAEHQATVLAPFATLDEVTEAIPRIVASGVGPLILEYIDMMTMAAMSYQFGIDLGIPEDVKSTALAYLVVMMEQTHADRLDDDVEALAGLVSDLGALDVYVLPAGSAAQLIDAREGLLGRQVRGCRRDHRHRRAAGVGARLHAPRLGARAGQRDARRRLRPRR